MCVTFSVHNVAGRLTGSIALGLLRLKENYFGARTAPTFRSKATVEKRKKGAKAAREVYLVWEKM
jgi:hypothetical protein